MIIYLDDLDAAVENNRCILRLWLASPCSRVLPQQAATRSRWTESSGISSNFKLLKLSLVIVCLIIFLYGIIRTSSFNLAPDSIKRLTASTAREESQL